MSENEPAMYGQCPKCGGNLAECFSRGCPRDPPKAPAPTPEELTEFQTRIRAAYAASKDRAMTPSHRSSRMSETFKEVEPLSMDGFYVERNLQSDEIFIEDGLADGLWIDVQKARALRDWLNRALGEEP